MLRTATSKLQFLLSRINDACLGIDTEDQSYRDQVDVKRGWPYARWGSSSKHNDSMVYEAAAYRNLRRIIRYVDPSPQDIFYDIGCGKGRAVMLVATHRVKRSVGIDISEALCAVARHNAEVLKKRKAPIEIRCGDAVSANISDGTIYFIYNAFGEATMREVLRNIRDSIEKTPRRIILVYYNSVLEGVFRSCEWLKCSHRFKTFTGRPITFWVNHLQTN